MSWAKIIIIVVLVIAGVSIFKNGWETTKDQPVQSMMDSSKYITQKGVDAYNKVSTYGSSNQSIGRPLCELSTDCDSLNECNGDCICYNGECYK